MSHKYRCSGIVGTTIANLLPTRCSVIILNCVLFTLLINDVELCLPHKVTLVFGRLSNLGENVCLKPENGIQLSPILRQAAEVEGV